VVHLRRHRPHQQLRGELTHPLHLLSSLLASWSVSSPRCQRRSPQILVAGAPPLTPVLAAASVRSAPPSRSRGAHSRI
jgi:hypothetical protein